MLSPNTETIASAGKFVTEATTRQQAADLRGALKHFTSAASILKSELERLSLESRISTIQIDPHQKNFLAQYIQQLEAQRQALETAIEKEVDDKIKERQKEEAERKKLLKQQQQQQQQHLNGPQQPSSNSTTTASINANNNIKNPVPPPPSSSSSSSSSSTTSDLFGGLSIPKHTLEAPKTTTTSAPAAAAASSSSSTVKPTPPSTSTSLPSSSHNLPSKRLLNVSELDKLAGGGHQQHNNTTRATNYAPRASDIVYKAIEHATKLAASHQYKTAADVIQHAYEVGCREDHRPKNLDKLPLFAKELRSKFQSRFPARIPQDNERTQEENEVLRSAGKTTRMLLSEWDDLDEGYLAENIWMPGRSDQAFQDDFIPRMAPDQMKWKPRYLRFHEIMTYFDRFDRLTGRTSTDAVVSQQPSSVAESSSAGGGGIDDEEEKKSSPSPGEQSQSQTPTDSQQNQQKTPIAIIASLPDPMTIKQTVVSDCSLVCSLIVTANYERRFPGARLIRSAIFPQDDSTGEPVVNRKGKYCVKMLINGTTRLIAIDDRFPAAGCCDDVDVNDNGDTTTGASSTAKTIREPEVLCSHTRTRGEMWVSLMEKAFIKVSGGNYDFPGSNSSNDLYRLSGWLPDVLRFPNTGQQYGANFDHEDAASSREKPFDADFQWRRLSTCHARGAVVLTIATPAQLPKVVEERLKLIPGHAYAVLDFKQVSAGFRLVKVKNPWSSQSWEGLFGIEDTRRCTPEMMQELNYNKEESDQGVFWMTWQDIVKFFAVAHLSWNPYSLFPPSAASSSSSSSSSSPLLRPPNSPNSPTSQKYFRPTRLARHAKNISTTSGGGEAPQFQIYIPPSALVAEGQQHQKSRRLHLVLSRHIVDDAEYEENELITAHNHNTNNNNNNNNKSKYEAPFITVHVYDTTLLPSLAAQCRAAACGDGDSLVLWRTRMASPDGGGRRLKTSFETGLVPCLHRGVYSNSAATTHSFDCPGGPRELTCVVARLPMNNNRACEPFSFSLTLYSNLPFSKSSNTSNANGFNFLAMPPLKASLRHRCVVPGEWIAGQNCGGAPGGQTFTFNPQYTFVLNQDSHILSELLSPIDCAVNVVICKVRDEVGKWLDGAGGGGDEDGIKKNKINPLWSIRADHLTSAKHPLVLCAPISSKYGSSIDSSLADCIAIGEKSRAPPRVTPSSPVTTTNQLSETTDPTSVPSSPASATTTAKPTKSFSSIHQLIHSLSIDIKIPTPHGPSSAFTSQLKDHLFLSHAIANCPISTWLVPLLLSTNRLCSTVSGVDNSGGVLLSPTPLSKVVCGGTSLTWSNQMNQNYLTEASAQLGDVLTLIVVPATESLLRTSELMSIEKALVALASNAIELLKLPPSAGPNFGQSVVALNDAVEKQIIALDSCRSCSTDEIKKTRSVLVRAAQELHKLLDFVSKNPNPPPFAPVPPTESSSSSSSSPSPTTTTQQQEKPNPLRGILTIPAGRYVVVAAAQEKGKPGAFSISLECEEEPVELLPLPSEGAGWRCPNTNLTSAWVGESAAGPPQGDQGWAKFKKNPTVVVTVGGSAPQQQQNRAAAATTATTPASNGGRQQNKIRLFCRLLAIPPVGAVATTKTPAMQLMMFKGAVSSESVVALSGKYCSEGVTLKSGVNESDDKIFGVPLDFGTEYHIVMSTFDGAKDSGWKCALKLFVGNDDTKCLVSARVLST